jgi:hypothetical protein
MPAKSRRDRRNISRNRNINMPINIAAVKAEPNTAALPTKTMSSYSQKPLPTTESNTKYLANEIKWIGIVTLVIVILLFVSYYIFR